MQPLFDMQLAILRAEQDDAERAFIEGKSTVDELLGILGPIEQEVATGTRIFSDTYLGRARFAINLTRLQGIQEARSTYQHEMEHINVARRYGLNPELGVVHAYQGGQLLLHACTVDHLVDRVPCLSPEEIRQYFLEQKEIDQRRRQALGL